MGRLCGTALVESGLSTNIEPGAYALMGAAAMLAGVTRMTLTLAALLVEVTKDVPVEGISHPLPRSALGVEGTASTRFPFVLLRLVAGNHPDDVRADDRQVRR